MIPYLEMLSVGVLDFVLPEQGCKQQCNSLQLIILKPQLQSEGVRRVPFRKTDFVF